MMDYRAAVAPFLESIRTERTTPRTLKDYTDRLNTAIDFLEQRGGSEITEDYYAALEESLIAGGLAASTVKGRLSLSRRFFTWAAAQEGDRQIPMNEITQETQEAHEEGVTVDEVEEQRPAEQEPIIPPLSSVEADEQHPQEEEAGGRHKNTGKPQKMTVYPDAKLDADIKDLARIDGLPVSTFILNLIRHEVQGRREDLELLRRIRARRA